MVCILLGIVVWTVDGSHFLLVLASDLHTNAWDLLIFMAIFV